MRCSVSAYTFSLFLSADPDFGIHFQGKVFVDQEGKFRAFFVMKPFRRALKQRHRRERVKYKVTYEVHRVPYSCRSLPVIEGQIGWMRFPTQEEVLPLHQDAFFRYEAFHQDDIETKLTSGHYVMEMVVHSRSNGGQVSKRAVYFTVEGERSRRFKRSRIFALVALSVSCLQLLLNFCPAFMRVAV